MRGSGNRAPPLTHDEKVAVFKAVARGDSREDVRRALKTRDPTTVSRVFNVAREFENRELKSYCDEVGQKIAETARYSTTEHYVSELFTVWRAWRSSPPMAGSPAVDRMLGNVLSRIWIPDAEKIPIDLGIHGPGPHTESVEGREFSWEQADRQVVRCWLTAGEEKWLEVELSKLSGAGHPRGFDQLYSELQDRACKYATEAARYRWDIDTGQGRVPLRQLHPAGGWRPSQNDPEISNSLYLIEEGPRLRGLLDQFVRDAYAGLRPGIRVGVPRSEVQ